MLKPKTFANAVTIMVTAAYILCGIISYIAPDLVISIVNSWLHTINLETVRATTSMPLGNFVFGVATFGGYIWILTYSTASLYNRLAK